MINHEDEIFNLHIKIEALYCILNMAIFQELNKLNLDELITTTEQGVRLGVMEGRTNLTVPLPKLLRITCKCSCKHWIVIWTNPGACAFNVKVEVIGDTIQIDSLCPNCCYQLPAGNTRFLRAMHMNWNALRQIPNKAFIDIAVGSTKKEAENLSIDLQGL